MTSEIRANTIKNRVGLGTVSFTDTGTVVSGIVTSNTLRLPDATSGSLGRLQLGNGLHFSMYHDGTNSHIINNNGYLTIQSQAGVNGIFIARNAEVNLYHGPSVRLQTSSSGVTINRDLDVDGHTNLDNVSIAGVTTAAGNVKIRNSAPSLIFDDNNHSIDYTFTAEANSFKLTDNTNGDRFIFSANGSASVVAPTFVMTGGAQVSSNLGVSGNLILSDIIYHNNDTDTRIRFPSDDNISFETGGTERLRINSNGLTVPDGDVNNNYISAGNSQDIKIYHDGSHSYIRDIGTGGLRITTNSFNVLNSSNGESMITGTEDGAVKLYYDHNLRLETQTSRTIFRGSGGIGVYGDAGQNQNGQISIHPVGSAVYSNLLFYNAAGNSYASIIGHAGGTLFFTGGTNGPLRHRVSGTGFHSFQEGNTQRVTITAGGTVNIGGDFTNTTGKLKVTGNSIFNGDIDVDGHTNLDNVNIVGVTTTNGNLNVNGVSYLYGSGGAAVVWGNTGYSGHLSFDGSDNAVIRAASGKALIFQTDHVNERLRINANGHLSLGGSNVTDVNMITLNGSGVGQNIGIVFNKTNSPARAYGINVNNTSGDLIFFDYTANSERVRITSEGYLHLGNSGHGTNKVGGQAITGQDLDAVVKLYSSNSNLWLAQLRADNTSTNGVFMRAGNSSSTYTLYATGYDENNPHLIVRGDGAVLIGESTQAGMQRGDVVVHASIQSGNASEPAVIHRNTSGAIIYFEHYFQCTKGGAGNSHTVNQNIIEIQNIGNFHQAVFHCWMGVRLQGQQDNYTRPATWQTGVNRFNGGSSIQFQENWISADSATQQYANLHVGASSSSSYYVRMNWPAGTYGSSFAGGKIMGTFLLCDVANNNITFAYGRT